MRVQRRRVRAQSRRPTSMTTAATTSAAPKIARPATRSQIPAPRQAAVGKKPIVAKSTPDRGVRSKRLSVTSARVYHCRVTLPNTGAWRRPTRTGLDRMHPYPPGSESCVCQSQLCDHSGRGCGSSCWHLRRRVRIAVCRGHRRGARGARCSSRDQQAPVRTAVALRIAPRSGDIPEHWRKRRSPR